MYNAWVSCSYICIHLSFQCQIKARHIKALVHTLSFFLKKRNCCSILMIFRMHSWGSNSQITSSSYLEKQMVADTTSSSSNGNFDRLFPGLWSVILRSSTEKIHSNSKKKNNCFLCTWKQNAWHRKQPLPGRRHIPGKKLQSTPAPWQLHFQQELPPCN